jgi:ribosomal protein S18 acetylase RimI-like enzyme
MQETVTGPAFRRRPIAAGDDAFLRVLEADRWGVDPGDPLAELQFRARQQGYRSGFPDGDDWLVVVDDEPAGRILVAIRPAVHHVIDVALLRRYRGRGIGTALMLDVQRTAAAAGVPVQLTALAGDARLIRWYERLGFTKLSAGDVHVQLAWATTRAG